MLEYARYWVNWLHQEYTDVCSTDVVKLVRSRYTWLHQRADHFNTRSHVCLLSVLMLIKLVLHLMSVWKH